MKNLPSSGDLKFQSRPACTLSTKGQGRTYFYRTKVARDFKKKIHHTTTVEFCTRSKFYTGFKHKVTHGDSQRPIPGSKNKKEKIGEHNVSFIVILVKGS